MPNPLDSKIHTHIVEMGDGFVRAKACFEVCHKEMWTVDTEEGEGFRNDRTEKMRQAVKEELYRIVCGADTPEGP